MGIISISFTSYSKEGGTMLTRRLCFLVFGFYTISCFAGYGDLTVQEAIDEIHANAEAMFLMPLKAMYQEENRIYFPPSKFISYLPDGKVIVKQEGINIVRRDPFTAEVIGQEFGQQEAFYDSTIDMAFSDHASSNTLYLLNKRYRIKMRAANEGFSDTIVRTFDGAYTHELHESTRPNFRPKGFIFAGRDPSIINPLGYAYHRPRLDNFDSYALEREGDLYKLTCQRKDSVHEYLFDPSRNYINPKFRLLIRGQVVAESTASDFVRLADLYLPTNIEYATYTKNGKPKLRFRALNMKWELVGNIEEKFTIDFPEGTMMREIRIK
jgi:hypothetical protein